MVLRDAGAGGGGAEFEVDEEMKAWLLDGLVEYVVDDPTEAQPALLVAGLEADVGGGAVGVSADETVAQPDFLNPEGFASPSLDDAAAITGVTLEVTGLAILTPAAFAALLNSFSSLLLSFSFLSCSFLSASSLAPAPTIPIPLALAGISFMRAL